MTTLTRSILAVLLSTGLTCAPAVAQTPPGLAKLCAAAKSGDVPTITRLLDAGTPIDATDAKGWQPIIYAIKSKHHRALLLLLKRGADPNTCARSQTGTNALGFAAEGGDLRLVQALINAGAKPNRRGRTGHSGLDTAVRAGHKDIVAYLLKHGADPNGWGTLDDLGRQNTPLYTAAKERHPDIVALLLKSGARVDQPLSNGDPVFTIAAGIADTRSLQLLIDAGATLEAKSTRGAPPLIIAIDNRRTEAVRFLLERGAIASGLFSNFKGEPCTPIEAAKKTGDRQMIALVERAAAKASK